MVVSNFSNPKFTIRILRTYYAYHMVYFGIGQDLSSQCDARNNLPETWASINQTLGKSGCIYYLIATTNTEAFSEFIKFKYFQLLIASISLKLIYFTQYYHTLNYRVQSHHSCNLNEMFRYSLLHKRIICTPFPFHRAFPATNWSWLPSSCTYYPAFITALEMVLELSSIHYFSH